MKFKCTSGNPCIDGECGGNKRKYRENGAALNKDNETSPNRERSCKKKQRKNVLKCVLDKQIFMLTEKRSHSVYTVFTLWQHEAE
jgi:hypothetical protein